MLFRSLVAAALAAACGGPAGGAPASPRDDHATHAYAGRQAQLFDDTIEPAAVGLDLDGSFHPRTNAKLRERAQSSDAVLRVRVTTLTAKTDGPDVRYQMGLHTVEKLTGDHPPETDFSVEVTSASESHGILKNFGGRLVGAPFIALVHEFVRTDGEREIHFHLVPDTNDVKNAIGDALALRELGE